MDEITIKGIECYAYHGVMESERQLGQLFRVDCTLRLDSSTCQDDINSTVHYGELTLDIIRFCREKCYQLIETLANELAQHLLLSYPGIEELSLTIHKPHAPIPAPFSDVSITVTRGWKTCYLAIGSNLGDRKQYLDLACAELSKDPHVKLLAQSTYLETEPYGVTDQPPFLNGALKIKTTYTPAQLLACCHRLEALAGRVKTRHWGERTLDVDILLYWDLVMESETLTIPHPDMHRRSFVLEPLCQLAPDLLHPVYRQTMRALLADLQKA